MKAPEMGRAGAPTAPAPRDPDGFPTTEITSEDTARHRHHVDVPAVADPPSARRRGWHWRVVCPFCSVPGVRSVHVHRSNSAVGVVRRSGCDRGTYRLVRVDQGWVA